MGPMLGPKSGSSASFICCTILWIGREKNKKTIKFEITCKRSGRRVSGKMANMLHWSQFLFLLLVVELTDCECL